MFGIEAPHIRTWESDSSHYGGDMTFTSPMDEVGKLIDELKSQSPDVIIGLCHYGENGEKGDAGMYKVAKEYANKVDAFLIGHAHSEVTDYLSPEGNWSSNHIDKPVSVLMETGCNGANVGKLSIDIERDADDKWKVVDRRVELISCKGVEPDPGLVKLLEPVHKASIAKANTVVGKITANFYDDPEILPHIPKAIVQDGPLLDLVNMVQMDVTGADISMSSPFSESANLEAGDFRFKDGVKIYPYDNTLVKVKVTGDQLKKIMEECAGCFFNQCKPGDVTVSFNPSKRIFEYDAFKGVNYNIDVSRPEGDRIVDLQFKGKPVNPNAVFTLALNNYRYGALVNKQIIDSTDVLYTSVNEPISIIRDMIVQYVTTHKSIQPVCDNNWKIVGYSFDDPQLDLIYDMILKGQIEIPCNPNGRSVNIRSINANELRAAGVIPPLKDQKK